MPNKKPNRVPNQTCVVCPERFYGSPSGRRTTCSMECRKEHYRRTGNHTKPMRGADNPRWKGGRYLLQGRYWLVLSPEHPHGDRHGYVREHRLVMEKDLGRLLTRSEVVHHRNGDTRDNRIENLELFASNAEHKHMAHGRGMTA